MLVSVMKLQTFAAVTAFTLIVGLTALSVHAQMREHPAVQRYNRVAKGSDVAEWQRRLGDDDVGVRLEAVELLGTKGGDEGVKPLIDALSDADSRVRIKAIDGLGMVGSAAASPVLMQLLFLSDVDRPTKLRVLTSLGRIGDPATSERLLSYARTVDDEELSCRAVYALGEIGDPASREGLEQLQGSSDDPHIKRLSSDALSKIDARLAAVPGREPTILELERRLAPPQEGKK